MKKKYNRFAIATMLLLAGYCSYIIAGPVGPMLYFDLPLMAEDSLKFKIKDKNSATDNPNNPIDLKDPKNVDQKVTYDPKTGKYIVSEKIGETPYRSSSVMSFKDYLRYSSDKEKDNYWRSKSGGNSLVEGNGVIPELYVGSELFDRLFGGSSVDIRPSGNIEITFGGNYQKIDNPILLERQRKQGGFEFDMNINMNIVGKIGEKLKLTTNYNTGASFDFENQVKLQYTGFEDEIIQSIEAGNVSLPLKGSLITGAQSLFGLKTELQFGRLTITSVLSQQKSQKRNIRIENGAQTREFEIEADKYEANKHFFLGQYFREQYNDALSDLPTIKSQVNITKMEVWVTNEENRTEGVREIVALTDLGEKSPSNINIGPGPSRIIDNDANGLYADLISPANMNVRFQDDANNELINNFGLQPVADFKIIQARKLRPNDFYLDPKLGYISLNIRLDPDEVLAVAFEYTYNGKVYQVGEFAQDVPVDPTRTNVLFTKMLKSSAVSTSSPLWDIMMKNIYSLGAFQINNEDFRLDVYYKDPGGGEKRFIPSGNVNGIPLIELLDLDQLNTLNDPQPDGLFDFIPNVTIRPQNGRLIFPVLEPFGEDLRKKFDNSNIANRFVYDVLYDSTITIAQQFPELNRYVVRGKYKSSVTSSISLGAFNLPKGSVVVTAGGRVLTEGTDYDIDYNIGRVKILNDAILQSGVPINVNFENPDLFGFQTKSLMGSRLDYWINDDFTLGGTVMRLTERPFSKKINVGDDPIANTIVGLDGNYFTKAPGLTRFVDKLPLIETKEESSVSLTGEVAKFFPGHSRAINNQSREPQVYIDDFEGSSSEFDIKFPPIAWKLASTPVDMPDEFGAEMFPESALSNALPYGYNRAKLAWYTIDPVLLGNNAPNYDDSDERAKVYNMEIREQDVFPNRQSETGIDVVLSTLNLAYYPTERGPYNYDHQDLNPDGSLKNPEDRWGGIMRKIDYNDFEATNIEFIDFWMLDPFILDPNIKGDFYIHLGAISEDILKDSRKFFENGIPEDGDTNKIDTTAWGIVPRTQSITDAFAVDEQARAVQDAGFDGLRTPKEEVFFSDFIDSAGLNIDPAAVTALRNDPSSDDFLYHRDASWGGAGIQERYKRFNGQEDNSPVSQSGQNFISSSTNLPDKEDINNDNSLNRDESYFQYRIKIDPSEFVVGKNFITDVHTDQLENGSPNANEVNYYHFKIPIDAIESKVGGITDFRSIQYIRMVMANFDRDVLLRFPKFDLVRNQWRRYNFSLVNPGEYLANDQDNESFFNVTKVDIEENSSRQPIPYVLPPGIDQEDNFSAAVQGVLQNEQSMSVQVCDLKDGDSRAVFKTIEMDLRQFKKIKMFMHAEELPGSNSSLADGDVTAFMRIGSDFTANYYEYEIPLKVTTAGTTDPALIWPEANEFDFALKDLIKVKEARNAEGVDREKTYFEFNAQGHRITVRGTPDMGDARTIMLGLRNPSTNEFGANDGLDKCAEVWFNELRLSDFDEQGGWAALARADVKLADFGNVVVSGNMHTQGYGSLEQRLEDRFKDNFGQYDVTGNFNLDKMLPKKLGLKLPVYAQVSESWSTPQFDPYESDIVFKDQVRAINADNTAPTDSVKNYKRSVQDYTSNKSLSFSNIRKVKTKKDAKSKIYDIENVNVSYGYSESVKSSPYIEEEKVKNHRGSLGYAFSPKPKYIKPLDKVIKSKSKYFTILKDINFNVIPNSLVFRTEVNRKFGVSKLRPLVKGTYVKPNYFKDFNWNRTYGLKYNPMQSIAIDYSASNTARIDEPEGKIDNDFKRDSIKENIRDFGRTTFYNQSAGVNYKIPFNKFPLTDWINGRVAYNSGFSWYGANRTATALSYKNTIENNQDRTANAELDLKRMYDKVSFLKKYNRPPKPVRPKSKEQRQKEKAKAEAAKAKAVESGEMEAIEKKNKEVDKNKPNPFLSIVLRPLLSVKRVSLNYSENFSTTAPGFKYRSEFFGQNFSNDAPGLDFVFGMQPENEWLDEGANKGWFTTDTSLNNQFLQTKSSNITGKISLEPYPDIKIDLNFKRNYTENHQEYFRNTTNGFKHLTPYDQGSYTISYIALKTLFDKRDDKGIPLTFRDFENSRQNVSSRLQEDNPNSLGDYINPSGNDTLPGYKEGYGPYSQDVLIPAFLSAYFKQDEGSVETKNLFNILPLPNWRISYNGLNKLPFFANVFKNVNLSHGYTSTMTLNSFTTNLAYDSDIAGFQNELNVLTNNFYSELDIPQVIITEQLSPLIGIDLNWLNDLQTKFEYRLTRNLNMSFIDYQLIESRTRDLTAGLGYRIKDVKLPIKMGKDGKDLTNDIKVNVDFSVRENETRNYKLDQNFAEDTRGSTTIRLAPSLDYVINNQLNVRLFFDWTRTKPKVSTSFPITNARGGLTIRFTLAP